MKREDYIKALQNKLDEIHSELVRIGFWRNDLVDYTATFDINMDQHDNNLSFPEWLQAVFLPTARWKCAKLELPEKSHVGMMALKNFDGHPEADKLVSLLNEFDKMVMTFASELRKYS